MGLGGDERWDCGDEGGNWRVEVEARVEVIMGLRMGGGWVLGLKVWLGSGMLC